MLRQRHKAVERLKQESANLLAELPVLCHLLPEAADKPVSRRQREARLVLCRRLFQAIARLDRDAVHNVTRGSLVQDRSAQIMASMP